LYSSSNIRINSGIANVGWVSLSYIAKWSAKSKKSTYISYALCNISYIEALTKKYSYFNLNLRPSSVASFGYKTNVIFSAESLSLIASK